MPSFLSALPPELYVLGLVAAFGACVFVVLNQLDDRAAARASLRQLDGYKVEDQREQELLAPLHQRVLGPAVGVFGKLGGRFNPPEYVESIRSKHMQAGLAGESVVERFLATRILLLAMIPVWLVFVFFINPMRFTGMLQLAAAGIGVAGLAMGPAARLNSKVEERQRSIQRSLPDVLDLLVISVEAGLGFEQAVDRVIHNVPGELSDEFARVLGETSAGSTRADALRALQERVDIPEVRSFVMAMIQADQFGVSIGRVLRSQADEMRIKRRQLAQERAQKAPVKMLIPMVFCVFPALFVVILGPALMSIVETLG